MALHTHQRAVRKFLTSAFTISELRVLVGENYPEIMGAISFSGSDEQIAFELVHELARRGFLGELEKRVRLKRILSKERPYLQGQVDLLFKDESESLPREMPQDSETRSSR